MTAKPDRDSDLRDHISRLERELAEVRASLPKHSTPPAMVMRLEELEDALEAARAALQTAMTQDQEA